MAKKAKKVLIVDNDTQYIGELTSKVEQHSGKKAKVDTVKVSDVKSKKNLSEYDAIILSGSTHRGYRNTAHQYVLDNARDDAYILGVCHGHQSLAYLHGGKIENLGKYQSGNQDIEVTKGGEVIGGKGKINVFKKHKHVVTDPGSLEAIAESAVTDAQGKKRRIVEAMKHPSRNIYTIQGHPEKGGHGEQILYRLLDKAYGK